MDSMDLGQDRQIPNLYRIQEGMNMVEEQTRLERVYTYTYEQFTVFFYENHVFIGGREYPIGQCGVDVVNLDEAVLNEMDQRVSAFIPAALALLAEKTDSAAALAQEKLNAVWDIVFSLPVYRDLNMDEECNYHTFQRLIADKEKWAQVQDLASAGYAMYQGMMAGLACLTDSLRRFRRQITAMAERYLEPLKRRNSAAISLPARCLWY